MSTGVRNEVSVRSLSSNERDFLRQCALGNQISGVARADGRRSNELRKINMMLSRRNNGSECTVLWGETRVSADVTASLQPPYLDRPSEGVISISVDTSPIASTSFGLAALHTNTPGPDSGSILDEAQKLLGNRIVRNLEKAIIIGGALDTEALCEEAGVWVWRLSLVVRILGHGGNLVDAAVLASLASLRHYRKPYVVAEDNLPRMLHANIREPTPLPIHHTPLSMTFALVHADDVMLATSSTSSVAALVDPTEREELVQTGALSLAMNIHGEVCVLDFGGGCELSPSSIKRCWKVAEEALKVLCRMLETSLKEADAVAQTERLQQLKTQQSGAGVSSKDPVWQEDSESRTKTPKVDSATNVGDVLLEKEEEEYRLRALEYKSSHVAAKVAAGRERVGLVSAMEGNSLLSAMRNSDGVWKELEHSAPKTSPPLLPQESTEITPQPAAPSPPEETVLLQKVNETGQPTAVNDDDVTDLAMAVKKKKKKKSKKK